MTVEDDNTEYFELTHDLVSKTKEAMDRIDVKITYCDHRGYCLVSTEFLQYLKTLLDIQNHYTQVQTETLAQFDEETDRALAELSEKYGGL